jgi:oxidase EvaA
MIDAWVRQRREDAELVVEPISWNAGQKWFFDSGTLRHQSGGFFSITGIEVNARFGNQYPAQMPIIDQPEIGILAFLVTQSTDGPRWLLQAKGEPGSEGFVQIGPTVQATRSNYLQRHGGGKTAYLDSVAGSPDSYLSWTQQSEQGTRFLGKYNTNILCEIDEEIPPHNSDWKWVDCHELRAALAQDYLVNTDARSVLVCGDWRSLCEDAVPFSSNRTSFGPWETAAAKAEMAVSYDEQSYSVQRVQSWLLGHKKPAGSSYRKVALESMSGWNVTENAIQPQPGIADFEVRYYQVKAPRREVADWQQPLVCSTTTARYCLFLAHIDGVVKVCLTATDEPGFDGKVQLGPTWQSDRANPSWVRVCVEENLFSPIRAISQSDEGGRFMSSHGSYELVEIDPEHADLSSPHCLWLSLGEVQNICRQSGMVTNEARSSISLILSLL